MNRKTKNIIMIIILTGSIGLTGFTGYLASQSLNNNSTQQMGQRPTIPNQNSNDSNNQDNSGNDSSQGENQSQNQGTPPSIPDENTNNHSGKLGQNSPQILVAPYYFLFGIESLITASMATYLVMSKMNKKTFKETFYNVDKKIIAGLTVVMLTGGFTYVETFAVKKLSTTSTSQRINHQGGLASSVNYSATKTISTDSTIKSGSYENSTSNQNTLLVTGDNTVSLSNITVNKTGDSNDGDSNSFYGQNSGILAKSGTQLTISKATIKTSATGANGVFSYGGSATTNNTSSDGTTVIISDSSITTTKDNSGGIMTTGGGTMKATNLTINTSGVSSAAIRTDRGGGTVTVNKGTYTTTGAGSPTIYSTANITVSNATLTAKASEGVVIEGKNSVTLNNVKLTDTNNKLNGKSTTYKNIFLYQSQSGDAANGNSTFTSKNSTITTNKGDSFYITNTTAVINLTNNTIVNNDSTGNFLRAKADSWGTSGSNGGKVTLNMTNQKAVGNIVVDKVSTLSMNLTSSSYYEGTINEKNSAQKITLKLDASSKIKLTGDSYVTSLEDADSSYSNIDFNGYKLYVNGKAIN